MLLKETYSGWISHFVNQRGYLKNVKKIKITLAFFHVRAGRCWRAETYCIKRIKDTSNNLYLHNNNNDCICKVENTKSHWHRKFSVSAQIIAVNADPDLLKVMFTTCLHDNGHRISNTKKGVTPYRNLIVTFYRDNRVKDSEILKSRITFHTFKWFNL